MFKNPKIRKIAGIVFTICGGWTGIMSGGLSIPFAFAALYYQGHERGIFILLAFFALCVFAIRVVWKNYQLLEKLDSPKMRPLTLEMEIIHPADLDVLTSKKTYRVKVKNTHRSKTVKNLKVWIYDIEWPKSVVKPLIWSGIIFPYPLPEKGSENNLQPHDLAGDSWKEFDLMFVNTAQGFSERVINLAPFRSKNTGSPSQFKSVDADTSFSIEILPKDDSKLIFKLKVAGGDGDVDTITESYILKVPLLLPENSVDNQVANINSLSHNFAQYLPSFEKLTNPQRKPLLEFQTQTESVA